MFQQDIELIIETLGSLFSDAKLILYSIEHALSSTSTASIRQRRLLAQQAVWTEKLVGHLKYSPGGKVPEPGIYHCTVYRKEITSNKGALFSPQNHH
ncbi:hypothetical protein [Photorhabdus australis]|uniref:hypothetical protein n=1 Tax=Photorhabdus australis TaxID=286156 RepID=UPI00068ED360|nr:hypothetical protein [Photorhabdus australis]